MDIKTVTINLKNLMNKWFYTREQIHQLLEDYVTVSQQGILSVGLPTADKITLTTTNNAITTADVAEVTAKVTDNNNTAAFGVPVEFINRTTREVLYSGSTDENGEIDFQYFTEEAEILPIQAKISNDYVFRDDGRLNTYTAWDSSSNVTLEHYSTHTRMHRTDTANNQIGGLFSPLLTGYNDIDFKIKIVDGSADSEFCAIHEFNSAGTASQSHIRQFSLDSLNLSGAGWFHFHISVLDDLMVLYCKDTGESVKVWLDDGETYPYYKFYFKVSDSVATIDFSDVRINKCSDDLSMFIKDKENLLTHNQWSAGEYSHNLTGFLKFGYGEITLTSTPLRIGDNSIKIYYTTPPSTGYGGLKIIHVVDERLINQNIIVSCDLLNLTDDSARIVIECGEINHKLYLPKSSEITSSSISIKLTSTDFRFYITFNSLEQIGEFYASNFKCKIQ